MTQKEKRITFVTPGHISSNPRLVKEAIAFSKAGYSVSIVFTQYVGYLVAHDNLILKQNPEWEVHSLNWTGSTAVSKLIKTVSGLKNKIWQAFSKVVKRPSMAARLMNRHLVWQIKMAVKTQPGLFIAHNLGALPVCGTAGKIKNISVAFDAEDYHRGEPFAETPGGWIVTTVENTWIPQCSLTWSASPGIGAAYRKLFPSATFFPVLNVFPSSIQAQEADILTDGGSELKLFWFSQTVGTNRGLEDIFSAMGKIPEIPVSLTLLGSVSGEDKSALLDQVRTGGAKHEKIYFLSPVPENQLFRIAKTHAIGLALERNFPPNRDLCLTNKIFTYLSCGLSIIYSETSAQTEFWNQNPESGFLYQPGDADSLANWLKFLYLNPGELRKQRLSSLDLSEKMYNWESESQKLLSVVNPFF
ncbi:MAG: glycosyltransferase [Bacteroidetes bacterium]|nr:glycosyltransferase [Bacteroidota bacterium]